MPYAVLIAEAVPREDEGMPQDRVKDFDVGCPEKTVGFINFAIGASGTTIRFTGRSKRLIRSLLTKALCQRLEESLVGLMALISGD